ncbi:hypothetical protein DFH29DRAFT_952605 [Suillus ampliporus]|nr:hypothetical protein DFH29DRAFT_952605 [Suillus ampliporus]
MDSCYIDRLPDDVLCIIFKLVCQEDQATFSDYLETDLKGVRWDDWGDFECDYENWKLGDLPGSILLAAMRVCQRWHLVLSQIPSIWTVLQISFREGAAALEHVRTFLRYSGTHPLQVTLLWDDPAWIVPCVQDDTEVGRAIKLTTREEIMSGIHLVSIIQELYHHVHRWQAFTLRTTSIAHTYSALSFMSRPSVHPARILGKLHLQFVHNKCHAAHYINEPSLFPDSAPPIHDLLLFGINWGWPSSSMLSSHLVDLRLRYDAWMNEDNGNTRASPAKILWQLLGALVNLQTLALELDLTTFPADTTSIKLPHLRCLAIKSMTMTYWVVDFLDNAHMPNLRVLTLCVATQLDDSVDGVLDQLAMVTDVEEPSSYLLELDELHFLNFSHRDDERLLRRLYTQMATVKTLTLGPGADDANVVLAMGLLPTPNELAGLPLPGLRTLIIFDVPADIVRRIVLERLSLAGPLDELYYYEEEQDESVPDDWRNQVEKYYHIGHPESDRYRYCDIVGRQWSHFT